jgi:hypothetical protein
MTSKLIKLQPCIKSKLDIELSKKLLSDISELLCKHDKVYFIEFEVKLEEGEYYTILKLRIDGEENILKRRYAYHFVEDYNDAKDRKRRNL